MIGGFLKVSKKRYSKKTSLKGTKTIYRTVIWLCHIACSKSFERVIFSFCPQIKPAFHFHLEIELSLLISYSIKLVFLKNILVNIFANRTINYKEEIYAFNQTSLVYIIYWCCKKLHGVLLYDVNERVSTNGET